MLISYIHQNIVISTHTLYTERRPAPNGTDLLLFNYSSLNIMLPQQPVQQRGVR